MLAEMNHATSEITSNSNTNFIFCVAYITLQYLSLSVVAALLLDIVKDKLINLHDWTRLTLRR